MDVCVVVTLNIRNPKPRQAKITKVGRKWVTLDDGRKRFDAVTRWLDGGSYTSPGRVYADEREYIETTEIAKAWHGLRISIPHQAPKHFTVEDIVEIEDMIWPDQQGDA